MNAYSGGAPGGGGGGDLKKGDPNDPYSVCLFSKLKSFLFYK